MVAELECPICLEVLKDPFVTTCGHTFCYTCVTSHLQNRNSCPSCSEYLIPDKIYPNHLLKQVSFLIIFPKFCLSTLPATSCKISQGQILTCIVLIYSLSGVQISRSQIALETSHFKNHLIFVFLSYNQIACCVKCWQGVCKIHNIWFPNRNLIFVPRSQHIVS